MRRPRYRAKHDAEPGKEGKTGLSPELWESIFKALPGVIRAVAELIKVLGLH